MQFLSCCFRLHFPVFGGSGRVMSEDITLSGYNIPAGTFIFANMAAMSRMDDYFPEPTRYVPERWLRDDERAHLQTTWTKDAGFLSLPFSHGQRACPGKRFAEQGLYLAVVSVSLTLFKILKRWYRTWSPITQLCYQGVTYTTIFLTIQGNLRRSLIWWNK